MDTSSIAQLFKAVRLVVFHLGSIPTLQQTMSRYGFTPKRVQEGDTLLKNARLLQDVQEGHYDAIDALSLQIEKDREAALDVFKGHIAIAKSAFRKEPQVLKKLKIKKVSPAKWALVQQAVDFYKKAPQYMERLQQFGASREAFDQNKAAIEALLTGQALRLGKKSEAEVSTQQKKQAVKELREWYGEFRKLARIAFKKNPQLLETFGIVVLSAPKKRKKTSDPETVVE